MVYAVDLLGSGDSDDGAEPPSVEANAPYPDAILAALRIDRVDLLGHGERKAPLNALKPLHPKTVRVFMTCL